MSLDHHDPWTGKLSRRRLFSFPSVNSRTAASRSPWTEEFVALEKLAAARASSLRATKLISMSNRRCRGSPISSLENIAVSTCWSMLWVHTLVAHRLGNSKVLDEMLALNLCSRYVLSRAVVPVMFNQGSGAIVNVASRVAIDHAGGVAAYAASRAAAVAIIDSRAADLRGTGVRANSILPSNIDTDANQRAMPNSDSSSRRGSAFTRPTRTRSVSFFRHFS